ncbi:MAG: DNA-binding protein [Proteobacteria bacterium]|nr:DNA-binding protein [Pseudomonadota bacterium]
MDTETAARMCCLSARTLEGMRVDKSGPPYIKLGDSKKSKVIYRRKDLLSWLERQTVQPER